MEKFDVIRNVIYEELSKAELLQFLDTNETIQAAESAYKWLDSQSLQEQQQIQEPVSRERVETKKSTKTMLVTVMPL